MSTFDGFIGPTYVSQSPIADGERCVNFYVEPMESPNAASKAALYPCPGMTAIAMSGTPNGGIRGMVVVENVASKIASSTCYFVTGDQVWKFRPGFTQPAVQSITNSIGTLIGPIGNDDLPVSMTYGGYSVAGQQILLASAGTLWLFDAAGPGWSTGLLAATVLQVGFLDGFFIALDSLSKLYVSGSFDGHTWDPTQVVQRSTAQDPWLAMIVVHEQIWLFGARTTDIWYNAGTFPYPFRQIDGATLQVGIAAPFSVAELDNAPVWLGSSLQGAGIVFRGDGQIPTRISNYAVESAIQGYSTISDAIGWSYTQNGHAFYVLTFPTANATWVYDASTGLWHERLYWNPRTASWDAYRAMYHVYGNGVHVVGDRVSGQVYTLSPSVATDVDGTGMRRLRRFPHLSAEQVRVFFRQMQIRLESGLGLTTGQGSDPQAMLRWSNDGGKTWSNEHWEDAGMIGQYSARVMWDRLGMGRDRVFEVVVSDPIPWRMVAAYLTAETGAS